VFPGERFTYQSCLLPGTPILGILAANQVLTKALQILQGCYAMLPTRNRNARRRAAPPPIQQPRPPEPPRFSDWSTPAVSDSLWFASDFLLGAGMVIIQPSTQKIVLVHDGFSQSWFLPKGRKDVGETLEEAALREAHEESGYTAEFLPLLSGSRAPATGSRRNSSATTEPIFVSTLRFGREYGGNGGEYLTFWYVGLINEDAVREENTGMFDEQQYVSHLLSPQEAIEKLGNTGIEAHIVQMAWDLYVHTYLSQSSGGEANQDPPPRRATRSSGSRDSGNGRQRR